MMTMIVAQERRMESKYTWKGLFKWFQRLLQHAFNTVVEPNVGRLNRSFNIVESAKKIVESMLKQSVLNQISNSFVLENVKWH